MEKKDKVYRSLDLYTRLQKGEIICKAEEAVNFGVNEKSIQRDIEDIRDFLKMQMVEVGLENDIIYDYDKRGYRMQRWETMSFSNEEALAITKILLESRAFTKTEMTGMLDKMLKRCVPAENSGRADCK